MKGTKRSSGGDGGGDTGMINGRKKKWEAI